MKFLGLDGREHKINFCYVDREEGSSYHKRARLLLKSIFTFDKIFEEVYLPGSGGLTCDFFIPSRKKIIEVHGEQHYSFNIHFYRTKLDFLQAQQRDLRKQDWCNLNGIEYIELPFNESDEQWKSRVC